MEAAVAFPPLERFKGGVDALNRVAPSDRFPLLLSRVISSLPSSGGYAFSAKEEAQLADVLSLDAEAVRLVLETSAYVFERAALHALKAPQLLAMLAESGLEEAHCTTFAALWSTESAAFLARLRAKTVGAPFVLESTSWTVSLGMGSSAGTAEKQSTAVFDFALVAERPSGAAGSSVAKNFSVEFSRGELLTLFEKLDRVQQQIDALSS